MSKTLNEEQQAMIDRKFARLQDYKVVFSSVRGQKVLQDLMVANFMMRPTFVKDRDAMLINEGARNAVLRILTILDTDPEKLKNMIRESSNESTR